MFYRLISTPNTPDYTAQEVAAARHQIAISSDIYPEKISQLIELYVTHGQILSGDQVAIERAAILNTVMIPADRLDKNDLRTSDGSSGGEYSTGMREVLTDLYKSAGHHFTEADIVRERSAILESSLSSGTRYRLVLSILYPGIKGFNSFGIEQELRAVEQSSLKTEHKKTVMDQLQHTLDRKSLEESRWKRLRLAEETIDG